MNHREFLIYDDNYLDVLVDNHKLNKNIILIHSRYVSNDRLTSGKIYFIMARLKCYFEDRYKTIPMILYNEKQGFFIIWREDNLQHITIELDYGDYDKYFDLIEKINNLVSSDGYCMVFANNVIYNLEFGMVIGTSENFDKIKDLINNNGIKVNHTKGISEITYAMVSGRQYNSCTLLPNMTQQEIELHVNSLILYESKSRIEEAGYKQVNKTKKKLFVSYSHQNKGEVRNIIDQLRSYGLDFWIDEEQIDVGDRIIERVQTGISECDLPIIFLSHASKSSSFAKHELLSFLSSALYNSSENKNWFIVKLDDVEPNNIAFGLGDFKYFDLENQSVEQLVTEIEKKF